ncbi:MAG: hypothetical protein V3S24_13790 [Candidatus Tectomicrobia bacterium]
MQANERKSSQVVVEEYLPCPSVLVVTVLALLPLLTVVDIVVRVAAIAVGCQFFPFYFGCMTVVTGYFVVGSAQREFRILVVIELDLLPASFRMALGALGSQCTLMGIVELVAGVAGRLELAFEDVAGMTRFAGNIGV